MPRNRLRVCTARHLLPAKTGTRIPRVVLIYLKTHERRHMRYSLLKFIRLGDILYDDIYASVKIYSPINRLTILRTAAKPGLCIIGHIANSIFLVTGGRKEPMAKIFAGNQLETSIALHTNHHSHSLVPYKLIILCEINLNL